VQKWLNQLPFGLWTQFGPIKHVLNEAQIHHAKGHLLGEGHAGQPSAVSCTKIAELIDLPFGLWFSSSCI